MSLTPVKIVVICVLIGIGWVFRSQIVQQWNVVRGGPKHLSTWMEMNKFADDLEAYTEERAPPDNFSSWIDRRFPAHEKRGVKRNLSMDRYGSLYRLRNDRQRGLIVISCGPDQVCPSDDDIEVEVN